MKNISWWKILALSAVLIIAIVLIFRGNSCNRKSDVAATNFDSLQYYRNQNGELVAAQRKTEDDFAAERTEYLDSIADLHDTKVKYIKEVVTVTTEGKTVVITNDKPVYIYKTDTIQTDIQGVDAVGHSFNSPWFDATVMIALNGDSSRIDLTTRDTLRYVAKTVKGGGLFNRKTYLQVEAVNSNPHNRITSLDVYRQEIKPQKKFGIGLQAGYGFTKDFTHQPYLGIGISYNIIRL